MSRLNDMLIPFTVSWLTEIKFVNLRWVYVRLPEEVSSAIPG